MNAGELKGNSMDIMELEKKSCEAVEIAEAVAKASALKAAAIAEVRNWEDTPKEWREKVRGNIEKVSIWPGDINRVLEEARNERPEKVEMMRIRKEQESQLAAKIAERDKIQRAIIQRIIDGENISDPLGDRIEDIDVPPGEYTVKSKRFPIPRKPKDAFGLANRYTAMKDTPYRYQNCVYVDERNGKKVAVATDGKRLLILPYESDIENGLWEIDRKTMKPVRKIDMTFPKYERVIPSEKDAISSIKITDEFAQMLNAGKDVGRIGRNEKSISFHIQSGDVDVLLSPRYMHDVMAALREAGHPAITMELHGNERPIVLRAANVNALAVVMPFEPKSADISDIAYINIYSDALMHREDQQRST